MININQPNIVYIVEYIYWDDSEIVAVYDNEEAAIAHCLDLNTVKKHGKKLRIIAINVRTRKQLVNILNLATQRAQQMQRPE